MRICLVGVSDMMEKNLYQSHTHGSYHNQKDLLGGISSNSQMHQFALGGITKIFSTYLHILI